MALTDYEIAELAELLKQRDISRARKHFTNFSKYIFPEYKYTGFHGIYYEIIDRFSKGDIKKIIISMAPQHGKSQASTRLLPANMFGHNPNLQIAIASYSATQAKKFNRAIQQTMDSQKYIDVFPKTKLANSKFNSNKISGEIQTTEEFTISGYEGRLKAVGRGGALTGNPVDILILDDLYKDSVEANSPVVRESVIDFYTSVANTRLHNDSQQLIVFTRWHEDDLIGWLERKERVITVNSWEDLENIPYGAWIKINFEALKESEPTELDPRSIGESLFPERHSKEKLEATRKLNVEQFNCLYQGNPISKEGLMYGPFKTYSNLPALKIVKNYTDTADTGSDYLCSINYGLPISENDPHVYVLDVEFTQEPMEVTEPATINFINKWQVNECDIESNNGGRSFGRLIDANTKAYVNLFYQSLNKEARIYSNSARVNNEIVFPEGWEIRWSAFYNHITRFKKKLSANKNDDGPDVLTGIIEKKETFDELDIEIDTD